LTQTEFTKLKNSYKPVANRNPNGEKVDAECRRCGDTMWDCPITEENIDQLRWHHEHPDCYNFKWWWWEGPNDTKKELYME
jgi:hypothetical protein